VQEEKLLGTAPDAAIARRLGRTVLAVASRRRELGRPTPNPDLRRWTKDELQRLGTAPDSEIARRLNRSVAAVETQRLKLGLPCADPRVKPYTPAEDRLMGTMPDEQLARKLGRTFAAVQARRGKLGLPPFHDRRTRAHALKERPPRSRIHAAGIPDTRIYQGTVSKAEILPLRLDRRGPG
jgi:hypothetical protein